MLPLLPQNKWCWSVIVQAEKNTTTRKKKKKSDHLGSFGKREMCRKIPNNSNIKQETIINTFKTAEI